MADRSSTTERREVVYSGRVQGVGFRYTARQLARGRPVTGFVRNLPDGRVQLVVEGVESDVSEFLAALASEMSGYIGDAAADARAATGEFSSFDVRY